MPPHWKIGELAKLTAAQPETIRYYEREKLLPSPPRTAGNYRLYGQPHVDRLTFIRHCRALDMSLQEIRALLKFYDAPRVNCGGANSVIDTHIADISRRIEELKRLRGHLKTLRGLCTKGQAAKNCEMLQELSAPPSATSSKRRQAARSISK